MAIPQGSTIFNTAYFQSLISRINSAPSCAHLQALIEEEFPSIQGLSTALETQYAQIAPIIQFIQAGAPAENPAAIVTWINTFLSLMGLPYVVPYATIVTQQAQLTAQIGSLTTAIQNAQEKFKNCSVSIPTIT